MKSVLITGAAGGMGAATARLFASKGIKVFGLDINEKCIDGVRMIKADVTNGASVRAAFETVKEETECLDAIIHFAGKYDLDSLVEMSEERFLSIFELNLFGIYRVNREFLPLLSEESRIIMTSSELAPLDPLPFTGVYAVTKAAIEKYAYSLRMEVQLLGIKVSVIRPGAVKTGLLDVSTAGLDRFCNNTKLYPCNADRFRKIVNTVEARNVPPERIAKTAFRAFEAKRPNYVYSVNRNPYLLLMNILPKRVQTGIIRLILKK